MYIIIYVSTDRAVGAGMACPLHPDFGRSVNPISTGEEDEGRKGPPHY